MLSTQNVSWERLNNARRLRRPVGHLLGDGECMGWQMSTNCVIHAVCPYHKYVRAQLEDKPPSNDFILVGIFMGVTTPGPATAAVNK